MKAVKSILLSRFNKSGRIYRVNLKKRCQDIPRRDFESEIKMLEEKGIIQQMETMTEEYEYSITLYICNYRIVGNDGDIVYLGEKIYG